jgi:hypothetical protein
MLDYQTVEASDWMMWDVKKVEMMDEQLVEKKVPDLVAMMDSMWESIEVDATDEDLVEK